MNELDDIRALLSKMVDAVDLIATETADLVKEFQTSRIAPEFPYVVPARVRALLSAAESMRLVSTKVLGKTDHSATSEVTL